jgi:CheY-like chemotaxis protein
MATRLLLVAPDQPGRAALTRYLCASGYEVLERSSGADGGPPLGDFQPDLILVDHETDLDARLALRLEFGVDDTRSPVPVIEMCLGPDVVPAALRVLDRMSEAGLRPRSDRSRDLNARAVDSEVGGSRGLPRLPFSR